MKRKPPRPVADPLQVFNHGCRFLGTDQALRRVFGGSDWALTIAPPTMVLSAFASELFLKCLLILETNEAPENIHLLHVLYRRVSHKRRRRIEELWDADARPKLAGLAKVQNLPTDLPPIFIWHQLRQLGDIVGTGDASQPAMTAAPIHSSQLSASPRRPPTRRC
jgi:hypothetical protein